MRYEFGPFRLDTGRSVLSRGEDPIPITPKALQILRVLVENSGRIVDKDEILISVWAGVTVEGANLTQNIFALRRILGEKPRDNRFIVTVPGRGYRFVGEVRLCEPFPATNEPAVPNFPAKPARYLNHRKGFGLFALMVALGATFLSIQRMQHTSTDYSTVPLTSYLGSALCPSFAPGGERVAFSWDGEKQNNFDIYVKRIGFGLPLRLTTDPKPDLSPAWSPDGQTIAFLRLRSDQKADILLIPPAGHGRERLLGGITAPNEQYSRVRFLSWSPDGKWLVLSDGASTDAPFGLYLFSVDTGEKHRLTQPPPLERRFQSNAVAGYEALGIRTLHRRRCQRSLRPQLIEGSSATRRTAAPDLLPSADE